MTNRLFEKILVATDGSERNMAAVEEALNIGRACGSTVIAAYVMDVGVFESASPDVVVVRDTWTVIQREAEAALERIRSIAGDVILQTVTLEGKPAVEIVKYAMENKVDLIVVGTKGKRGFELLLLGSVAEKVVQTAPCKVLVVK